MKPRTEYSTIEDERFEFNLQEMIDLALEKTLPRPEQILLEYIEINYTGQGRLVPINKHESAVGGANIIRQTKQYEPHDTRLPDPSGTKVLIAKGVLKKDVEWVDSDPYQTAGGYVKGVARKGEEVDIFLSYDYTGFKVTALGEVNVLKDHYNNNFFGNSTGGGTKEFQEGERVERKTILGAKNSFIPLTSKLGITKIDLRRLEAYIRTAE